MRRLRCECENDANDRESKPGCNGRDYLIIVYKTILIPLWIHAVFMNKEVRRMEVAMLIGIAVIVNLLFSYCRISICTVFRVRKMRFFLQLSSKSVVFAKAMGASHSVSPPAIKLIWRPN